MNEFIIKNGLIVNGGTSTITGSLIITNGVTGSLQGTASYALSASYAPSTGGSSPIKLTNQTLASGSWVTSSGFYAYTFTNANINTNTRVDFTPDTASYLEVTTCGLQSQVNVSSGTSSFFSLFPPQSNITGEITIFPTV